MTEKTQEGTKSMDQPDEVLKIDVATQPTGPDYIHLIDYAIRHCAAASLMVYAESSLDPEGERILAQLQPELLTCVKTSDWPQKALKGMVYVYRCTPVVGTILKEAASQLYAWQQPRSPEDLRFYHDTEGLRPWLITTAHEREAFFCVKPAELLTMKQQLPGLHLEAHFF